jgi:hypothetical protein
LNTINKKNKEKKNRSSCTQNGERVTFSLEGKRKTHKKEKEKRRAEAYHPRT